MRCKDGDTFSGLYVLIHLLFYELSQMSLYDIKYYMKAIQMYIERTSSALFKMVKIIKHNSL